MHTDAMHRRTLAAVALASTALAVLAPAPAFAAQQGKPAPSSSSASPSRRGCVVAAVRAATSVVAGVRDRRRERRHRRFLQPVHRAGGNLGERDERRRGPPEARLLREHRRTRTGESGSWWPKSDSDKPPVGAAPYPTGALPVQTVTLFGQTTPIGCATTSTGAPRAASSRCAYVYGYVRAEAGGRVDQGADALDLRSGRLPVVARRRDRQQLAEGHPHPTRPPLRAPLRTCSRPDSGSVPTPRPRSGRRSSAALERRSPTCRERIPSNLVGLDEWGAGASSQSGSQVELHGRGALHRWPQPADAVPVEGHRLRRLLRRLLSGPPGDPGTAGRARG